MTLIALITQPLIFAAILWLVLRHEHARTTAVDRLAQQGTQTAQRLIDAMAAERDQHRQEVQALCQRLQAPERAVIQHIEDNTPPQSPWPLTEEESVQAQDARIAALAEIERLEAEEAAETRLMTP